LPAAIVSIHDVTPDVLPHVREIMRLLKTRGIDRVTLLIIPGHRWRGDQLAQLKSWQDRGVDLAGHGWRHRVRRTQTAWHRLHRRMMSRDAGEHLSLSSGEVAELVLRCHRWFETVGLASPTVYVPPAWAMGNLSRRVRRVLPFRLYETQWGLYDVGTATHHRLSVTGYMADTPGRCLFLRLFNAVTLRLPLAPIRIAIHPADLYLPLRADLCRHLACCGPFLTYKDVGCTGGLNSSRVCRTGWEKKILPSRPPVRS
jgi:hypothetical protein